MKRSSAPVSIVLMLCLLVIITLCTVNAFATPFESFVIREGGGSSPVIQENNDYVTGATEFITDKSGMKAGWGSNDLNGTTIEQISSLSITRHDDTNRFTAGSGPAVAPYFNIWVTDGFGNYAVIANEPSNPAFQTLFETNTDGSKTYDLSFADLADQTVKIYETPGWNDGTSWVHDVVATTGVLTFADLAFLEIAPPPIDYIADSANGVGSGAPDQLITNIAYGFNWIFGDTLSNYVSGEAGYIVSNPMALSAAEPVPEPGTLFLISTGFLGLAWYGRKRKIK